MHCQMLQDFEQINKLPKERGVLTHCKIPNVKPNGHIENLKKVPIKPWKEKQISHWQWFYLFIITVS